MKKYLKTINFVDENEQPLKTYAEIIYGNNGISIYPKQDILASIFIPYTSIHTIETQQEETK